MKIIIDTDPGADDMDAIFMVLGTKHAEIVAITTVNGNMKSDEVYRNAKDILSYCGKMDIPIHQGAEINMSGRKSCSNYTYGQDGLGNLYLEHCMTYKKEEMSSSEALHYYVNKYPGEIHLIAIGPLTNLATAFLLDNSFPQKLASLSVMGGDRQKITYGNITPFAEFNTNSDIFAWKLVMEKFHLSNNNTIKLIDLKTGQDHLLPNDYLDKFYGINIKGKIKSPQGALLRGTYEYISTLFRPKGRIDCDPLAAFICLYPQSKYSGKKCVLDQITLDGEAAGHTVFKDAEDGNIFLVEKIDLEYYLDILYKSIWVDY